MTSLPYDTILLLILGANVAAFALMGLDKKAAQAGGWRCPERLLLGVAVLGGSPALLYAMSHFRHKTRKEPFRTLAWAIFILHIVALGYVSFTSF